LNDLECPIHLKVRFTDGTLDVRTLWLSDSTIRIRIARGGRRGSGLEGLASLPPCGQLTRCFSAVAELLVLYILDSRRANGAWPHPHPTFKSATGPTMRELPGDFTPTRNVLNLVVGLILRSLTVYYLCSFLSLLTLFLTVLASRTYIYYLMCFILRKQHSEYVAIS